MKAGTKLPRKITPKVNKIAQHKKQLIDALTKTLGIVTTACSMCQLSRGIFYEYYNTDPEFRKQVDDIGYKIKSPSIV